MAHGETALFSNAFSSLFRESVQWYFKAVFQAKRTKTLANPVRFNFQLSGKCKIILTKMIINSNFSF